MIIVLKNADFSAQNIGQISFDAELDPAVVSMLNRYTRFPAVKTNRYAQALNMFYYRLQVSGVYDKLKLLSIPFYANDISECGVSIIDDNVTGYNFSTDFVLSGSNLLKCNFSSALSGNSHGFPISVGSNDSCCFAIAYVPNSAVNGNKFGIFSLGQTTNYIISKNRVNGLYNSGGWVLQCTENGVAPGGAALAARKIGDGPVVANYNNAQVDYRDSVGMIMKAEPSGALPSVTCDRFVPIFYDNSLSELYLYGCSEGLDSDERDALYAALDEFYNIMITP